MVRITKEHSVYKKDQHLLDTWELIPREKNLEQC